MANQLDELDVQTVREEGLDTHVIAKRLPAKVGVGSVIFEIVLWVLAIIPGLIFMFKKIKAKQGDDCSLQNGRCFGGAFRQREASGDISALAFV